MATSDLTGDLDQTRRHAAGRTNLLTGSAPPVRPVAAQQGPRPHPGLTYPPPGIGLTPDQQAAQRRTQQQQAMAGRINETRENVGGAFRQAARSVADSNPLTAGVRFAQNTTFDDRLPGQANREAARARQQSRQNADWVANNPEQAQAAGRYGQGIVERARTAGMAPPGGYPGISAPAAQQPIAGVASSSPAPGAPAGANLLTGSAPPPAPGVPAAGSPGQQSDQPIARLEPGQNLALDVVPQDRLTAGARAQLPVSSVDNRIVRDGNSFSANTPIRAGATVGSTDTLVGRQQDDGQPMARINSYSGQSAMDSNLLAAQIHQQTRLENSNPNYLTVVRDSSRGGIQGAINAELNQRDADRRSERRDQHQQRIQQGQQQIDQTMQQRRTDAVAADERLYTRSQDAIAEQRNQLGDELTGQQIEQGQMTVAQQRQLRDLAARMADPSLSAADRAEAERAYQALTVSARDRYMLQDVVMGYREDGSPIVGKAALDTQTGQMVSQDAQAPTRLPQGVTREAATADARSAVARGASREAVNQRLRELGNH